MKNAKKFTDELDALNSIANSMDLMLEFTYDRFLKKEAADNSPYYTLKETAARLKTTTKTISRWVKAGKITPANTEGKSLFFKTDVDGVTVKKESHMDNTQEPDKSE